MEEALLSMDNPLAIVLARHTDRPHVEGGGKVMFDIANALSKMGIKTLLFSFNYKNPYSKDNTPTIGPYKEINARIGFITQDLVLNTRAGSYLSNIVEFFLGGTVGIAHYLKYVLNNYNGMCLLITGNANKYLNLIMHFMNKVSRIREKKILVLFKRDELNRLSLHLLKPHLVIASSKELATIAAEKFSKGKTSITYVYPPVNLDIYKPIPLILDNSLFQLLGSTKFILYIGRVNEKRFPLSVLKYTLLTLREEDKDSKMVIVIPPEKESLSWVKNALKVANKYDLKNLLVITRILSEHEKARLYSSARAFMFPSTIPTAIEPPLTVLEAVACGTPIITSGGNSTFEIARSTGGFIFRNFKELRIAISSVMSSNNSAGNNIRREWAVYNLSYDVFCERIRDIISKFI